MKLIQGKPSTEKLPRTSRWNRSLSPTMPGLHSPTTATTTTATITTCGKPWRQKDKSLGVISTSSQILFMVIKLVLMNRLSCDKVNPQTMHLLQNKLPLHYPHFLLKIRTQKTLQYCPHLPPISAKLKKSSSTMIQTSISLQVRGYEIWGYLTFSETTWICV